MNNPTCLSCKEPVTGYVYEWGGEYFCNLDCVKEYGDTCGRPIHESQLKDVELPALPAAPVKPTKCGCGWVATQPDGLCACCRLMATADALGSLADSLYFEAASARNTVKVLKAALS